HACPACGYDLYGLAQNQCPECGRAFDPTSFRTAERKAMSRWGKAIAITWPMLLFCLAPLWAYFGIGLAIIGIPPLALIANCFVGRSVLGAPSTPSSHRTTNSWLPYWCRGALAIIFLTSVQIAVGFAMMGLEVWILESLFG